MFNMYRLSHASPTLSTHNFENRVTRVNVSGLSDQRKGAKSSAPHMRPTLLASSQLPDCMVSNHRTNTKTCAMSIYLAKEPNSALQTQDSSNIGPEVKLGMPAN